MVKEQDTKDKSRKKSDSTYFIGRLKEIMKANNIKIKDLAKYLDIKSQTAYTWFIKDSEPMWFAYAFGIINFLYNEIPTFDAIQFFKNDFDCFQINKYEQEIKKLNTKCLNLKSEIEELEKKRTCIYVSERIKVGEELIDKIKSNENQKSSTNYYMAKKHFSERLYDTIAVQLNSDYHIDNAYKHTF